MQSRMKIRVVSICSRNTRKPQSPSNLTDFAFTDLAANGALQQRACKGTREQSAAIAFANSRRVQMDLHLLQRGAQLRAAGLLAALLPAAVAVLPSLPSVELEVHRVAHRPTGSRRLELDNAAAGEDS